MDGISSVPIGIASSKNGSTYSDKADIVKMKPFTFGIAILPVIGGVASTNIPSLQPYNLFSPQTQEYNKDP